MMEPDILAAWIGLSPLSYVTRILVAGGAFAAAMDADRVFARVVGLVVLLITGGGLLLVGLGQGTAVDILLGIGFLSAAGYSWWFTRH